MSVRFDVLSGVIFCMGYYTKRRRPTAGDTPAVTPYEEVVPDLAHAAARLERLRGTKQLNSVGVHGV